MRGHTIAVGARPRARCSIIDLWTQNLHRRSPFFLSTPRLHLPHAIGSHDVAWVLLRSQLTCGSIAYFSGIHCSYRRCHNPWCNTAGFGPDRRRTRAWRPRATMLRSLWRTKGVSKARTIRCISRRFKHQSGLRVKDGQCFRFRSTINSANDATNASRIHAKEDGVLIALMCERWQR
jgi:hypothetical protein